MKVKSVVAAVVAAVVVVIVAITVIAGGGMTELRHEIHINASPEKVWSILANLEAVQHYNPTVAEAHYISA
ncbi:SRPBCC family protein, partial [Candidatus Saganbacteria bacterium]|nr:SRPBCC family protein [Candidatus Saganbacteria bacterium]